MKNENSFSCTKKFYAEAHFPYGIARSGEFNSVQSALLEKHGVVYQGLHTGELTPVNDEERDFVEVCKGLKEPQTLHERAWVRFCQKIQAKPIPKGLSVGPDLIIGSGFSEESEW